MGILSKTFDTVRKTFNPTPEERAEKKRNREISDLTNVLYRVILEERELDSSVPGQDDGSFYLLHMPLVYKSLTAEEVGQRVEVLSGQLVALGVSEDRVKEMVSNANEAKNNPVPFFPYML